MTTERSEAKYVSLLWALQDHCGDIARLHASLFEKPWDEAAIGTVLAHPGSVAMVVAAGVPRRVGGFALAQVAADEAELLTLGVAAAWQRHGVGAKLVDGIKRAAARAGANRLYLEVAQSNAPALALYAKAGFRETGRRKGYYERRDGTRDDAIMLGIDLKVD